MSEDIVVVATVDVIYSENSHKYIGVIHAPAILADLVDCGTELMTVEQCNRLLAAKDAEIERMQKLLSVAICPCCDGSGAYYDSYGEPAQCQFCDEKSRALNQKHAEGE